MALKKTNKMRSKQKVVEVKEQIAVDDDLSWTPLSRLAPKETIETVEEVLKNRTLFFQ